MIFLCFSSADRYTVVNSFLYHLKRYGIPVWYDYHELVLGDDKENKNFKYAINTADYFIIIYSKGFFSSDCAIQEENLIYKRKLNDNITVFPVIYNLTMDELPKNYRTKVSGLIYNELSDATGTLNTINQIVCRILLDEYNVPENEPTPTLYDLCEEDYKDIYIQFLFRRYKKIDPENFNARATMLLCLYKYLTLTCDCKIPEFHNKIVEYLTDYTNFNIRYNHKEITILELVVMLSIRNIA